MTDVRILIGRAFRGEYVPELPEAIRVNIARFRERAFSDLPALVGEAAGTADFERRWAEAVNRIIDEAEESLRLALE